MGIEHLVQRLQLNGIICHQTLKTAHCIICLNRRLKHTSLNAATISLTTVISSIFHQTDFVTVFIVLCFCLF